MFFFTLASVKQKKLRLTDIAIFADISRIQQNKIRACQSII